MNPLTTSATITSVELVTQINIFRNEEGNRAEILHKNLLAIIEDEFEDEINGLKIQPISYVDKRNRQSKCYELTKSQAIQVLVRESKFVRRAIVAKLEAMEKPKTQIDLIIESALAIRQTQEEVAELKAWRDKVEAERHQATAALLLAERSTEAVPEETTRAKIRRLINQYCTAKAADHRSVWGVIYDRLYYRYGISLRAVVKRKGESMLDVAERLGHLEKIFAICSSELV